RPRDLACSPVEPVVLVAGGPSLCLAAVVTGAERGRGGGVVRHRLVHRTRLPGEAAEGWLDALFAGSSLRLEAPYHLVRLPGPAPFELGGALSAFEPRAALPVKGGPSSGSAPSAWRHAPARPGPPLALRVPELAERPPSFLLAPAAAAALRGPRGRRVRAA